MGFSIDPSTYASLIESSLYTNNTNLTQAITRLATGLRINSAADDPAGMAISNVLQSQVSGLNQGVSNAQAGISLIQTASGALQNTSTTLQNMQTLATEAATGTYSASQVAAMQQQMNQYAQQIDNTVNTTTYNGKSLLSGALQNISLQIGPNAGDTQTLNIGPMDAATLGVAGNAANLIQGQNAANVTTLTNVGTGFAAASTGEQFAVKATNITTTTAATYNASGVASTSASAAQNQGSESVTLGGTYSGGTNQDYVLKVTSVNSQGTITGLEYAQANTGATGTLGSWSTATYNGTNFTLNNGITATFANGAATAQSGDTFTFTANSGAGYTNQQAGPNFSQATGTLSGTYTGTTNTDYAVRAVALDSYNNVSGVQVSTDGGHTWGSTIATTTDTSAAGTATAFSIGNGLTYTWNPGTAGTAFLASSAASNNDTFTFNAVAANQNVQFLQMSDTTLNSGGTAKFSGTAANIGVGVMLNAGQTSANLGVGTQTLTANFNAPGTSGGIQAGSSTFTVEAPLAAVVSNGSVLTNATAPAGINISNTAAASAAITTISNAISQVAAQEGQLGAVQDQLTQSITQMTNTSTNLQNSYTQITSANIAQETVNLTRAQITQQAALAMLAQANQIPSYALKLLQNLP